MKKILIVNKSNSKGGIQSALKSLIEELKHNYHIDLLLFNGDNLDSSNINIIKSNFLLKALGCSVKEIIFWRNPILWLYKVLISLWSSAFSNKIPVSLSLFFQKELKGYDLAISFHHDTDKKKTVTGFSRFIDKCVQAKVKATWIHYDALLANINNDNNLSSYNNMDYLVFVTKASMCNFREKHPELQEKMIHIPNFIESSKNFSRAMSIKNDSFKIDDSIIFYSALRFNYEKGIDRTLLAFKDVRKEANNFKWYISGDGVEKDKIAKMILDYKLQDNVFLLGIAEDPKPLMKDADVFLLLSRHEAGPVVIYESLLMGTPVLSTSTAGALELLSEDYGWICQNNIDSIKFHIMQILQNKDKIDEKRANLTKFSISNSKAKEVFIKCLLGDE